MSRYYSPENIYKTLGLFHHKAYPSYKETFTINEVADNCIAIDTDIHDDLMIRFGDVCRINDEDFNTSIPIIFFQHFTQQSIRALNFKLSTTDTNTKILSQAWSNMDSQYVLS